MKTTTQQSFCCLKCMHSQGYAHMAKAARSAHLKASLGQRAPQVRELFAVRIAQSKPVA